MDFHGTEFVLVKPTTKRNKELDKKSSQTFYASQFKQKLQRYTLSDFLKLFYNTGVFYFVSPFMFQRESTTGQYISLKPRWVFVLGVLTVQVFETWPYLYDTFLGKQSIIKLEGPSFLSYYTVFVVSMWLLTTLNLLIKGWTYNRTVVKLLNKLDQVQEKLEFLGVNLPSNALVRGMTIFFILFTVSWGCYENYVAYFYKPRFKKMIREDSCNLNTMYCLPSVIANVTSTEGTTIVPWMYISVSLCMIFGRMIANFVTHYGDVLILVHAVVFYLIVSRFIDYTESVQMQKGRIPSQSVKDQLLVLEIFEHICKLSDVMSDAIGSVIIGACFGMLPFYSWKAFVVAVDGTNGFRGFNQAVQLFIYVVSFGSFLIFAAETNSKIGSLRNWLQNSETRIGRKFESLDQRLDFHEKIIICLNQLDSNQVGIRCRSFTVTYGFVGCMVSLVLTYSVVIFQLNGN